MQRKKKRVQKGARGAEQQPKQVTLNKRRQHAAQADRSRPQNKQTTVLHAVFACASMHAMSATNQRRRARQKGCILPAVCCPSAGTSRPRQLQPARLTCEKRHRKSEGAAGVAGAMRVRAARLAARHGPASMCRRTGGGRRATYW